MFCEIPEDEQAVFWCACKETAEADSRFSYSKVRATLIKSLCERKIYEDSVEEFSELKPLSVWKTEGWDIASIEKNGKVEKNAVVGTVYAVPIKRLSSKVTYIRPCRGTHPEERAGHQAEKEKN